MRKQWLYVLLFFARCLIRMGNPALIVSVCAHVYHAVTSSLFVCLLGLGQSGVSLGSTGYVSGFASKFRASKSQLQALSCCDHGRQTLPPWDVLLVFLLPFCFSALLLFSTSQGSCVRSSVSHGGEVDHHHD